MEQRNSDRTKTYTCGGKNITEPAKTKYMYPSPILYQTLIVKNNNKEFSLFFSIFLILSQVKVII